VTEDARETIVAPAAQRARDVGGHRGIWLAGALAVLSILVLAGLMLLRSSTQQAQIDALATSATDNHATAQKLYDQVIKLGGIPAVQPPAVTGVAGPQGATGPQGPPGPAGPTGPSGPSGAAGQSGAAGAAGAQGNPGAAGAAGADGSTGATGPAGPQGSQGPAGPAGPTCPDGYSLGPAIIVSPDGSTHQGLACIQNPPPTSSSAQRIGR
jgi:type II secretory pathway pseudopilin PulG